MIYCIAVEMMRGANQTRKDPTKKDPTKKISPDYSRHINLIKSKKPDT